MKENKTFFQRRMHTRLRQLPAALSQIEFAKDLLKVTRGQPYPPGAPASEIVFDQEILEAMKGGVFGMIREIQAEAPLTPEKVTVLQDIGIAAQFPKRI